jgi:rubrerythrin
MIQGDSTGSILKILQALDMMIEILTDSSMAYQRMALEAPRSRAKALLYWFYNVETTRLNRLTSRRHSLLRRHPGAAEARAASVREPGVLTKMGEYNGMLHKGDLLEIMRYAIDNEIRAMQFYRKKAALAADSAHRIMYSAVVKEQEDHIAFLSEKRQELLQDEINKGADFVDRYFN